MNGKPKIVFKPDPDRKQWDTKYTSEHHLIVHWFLLYGLILILAFAYLFRIKGYLLESRKIQVKQNLVFINKDVSGMILIFINSQ